MPYLCNTKQRICVYAAFVVANPIKMKNMRTFYVKNSFLSGKMQK